MPAQPGATESGGGRGGGTRAAGGRRGARGRGKSLRWPGRWGTWQGGLGVCVIVAGTAIGAAGTVATSHPPGILLQLCVVAGTVAAGFAVRPRAGWMIVPVPVLSYLVAALVSGAVLDRSAGLSTTALAIAAALWIADGFFAMVLATVLAAAIPAARWILWRRGKPPAGDQGWPPSARAGRPPRRARQAAEDPRYPGAGDVGRAWGGPDGRGTAPRPGPGPYNFSSGA
jgi:hypothetical protein